MTCIYRAQRFFMTVAVAADFSSKATGNSPNGAQAPFFFWGARASVKRGLARDSPPLRDICPGAGRSSVIQKTAYPHLWRATP